MSEPVWSWPYTQHVQVGGPALEDLKPQFLLCGHCGDEIEYDDDCVELTAGKAGHGPMSGRPMVVEVKGYPPPIPLHLMCIQEYVSTDIVPDDMYPQEERIFCTHCGVAGEGPDFCGACGAEL